jgi:hypothetical protein
MLPEAEVSAIRRNGEGERELTRRPLAVRHKQNRHVSIVRMERSARQYAHD